MKRVVFCFNLCVCQNQSQFAQGWHRLFTISPRHVIRFRRFLREGDAARFCIDWPCASLSADVSPLNADGNDRIGPVFGQSLRSTSRRSDSGNLAARQTVCQRETRLITLYTTKATQPMTRGVRNSAWRDRQDPISYPPIDPIAHFRPSTSIDYYPSSLVCCEGVESHSALPCVSSHAYNAPLQVSCCEYCETMSTHGKHDEWTRFIISTCLPATFV